MDDVRARIAEFILEDMLFGDESRMPAGEQSLLQSGVIDSTGILELIEFIETEFGFHVEDHETIPENLDGINRMAAYVQRKRATSRI